MSDSRDENTMDHRALSRRSFIGAGAFAVAALMLDVFSLGSLFVANEAQAAQTHFEGEWYPEAITNGGNIYLRPRIKVVVDYEPGDDYMRVTVSRISLDINGWSSEEGDRTGFWDSFALVRAPYPGDGGPYYHTPWYDTGAIAQSNLNSWASQYGRTIIWAACQSNKNSTWASNNLEYGYIIDHPSYSFNVDVRGLAPGTSPDILSIASRWQDVVGTAYVGYHATLNAAALGITVKVSPKIVSSAGTGGSISPNGTRGVEYGGSQSYTMTPSRYYRIKDVKVDGSSVGKVSTYNFTNVIADHTIHVDFESISGTLNVQKRDKGTGKTTPQGNASFNQTKWTVTCVDSPHYTNGSTVATLTSNASGAASVTLKGGKFKVKETTASGTYDLTDTGERSFEISSDGQTINYTGTSNSFENEVERGGVELKKGDADFGIVNPQGNAGLSGAVFKVYNVSTNSITMGSTEYATYKDRKKSSASGNYGTLKYGEYTIDPSSSSYKPCLTLTTDANGYITSGNNSLPVGTYVIFEVTPPTGYRINSQLAEGVTFSVTDKGDMVSFTA